MGLRQRVIEAHSQMRLETDRAQRKATERPLR